MSHNIQSQILNQQKCFPIELQKINECEFVMFDFITITKNWLSFAAINWIYTNNINPINALIPLYVQ